MELRPYQVTDVEELMKHDTYAIFNEQRTGKTPTSLVVMDRKCSGRILIVATASMIYQWKAEADKWVSHRNTYVIDGTPKKRSKVLENVSTDDTSITIMSHDMIKSTSNRTGLIDTVLLHIKPEGIIIDEVHRCVGSPQKAPNTELYKAINKLRNTPHRLYLSGTPTPAHPVQAWAILSFINPKVFTSFWRFAEEFFDIKDQYVSRDVAARTGLSTTRVPSGFIPDKRDDYINLLDQYSIMRKRKEVMPWLQDMPTIRIVIPPTPSQQKHIDSLDKFFITEDIVTQGILDRLIRVRQICLAPEILGLKGPSPKIDWLHQYVKDYPEQKVVIFSNFTTFLKLYESKTMGVGLIVGETSNSERQRLINDFQNGTLNILAIQTQAGMEGLTLDAADTLIFTDMYPPAGNVLQAKDRIVATSHERNTTKQIIELALKDTYDEALFDLVHGGITLTDVANSYKNYLKEVKR